MDMDMAVIKRVDIPFESVAANDTLPLGERESLEAAVADLYSVIAVLDST